MCEWRPDFDSLNERVTKIEGRMSQMEHDVGKMRSETQEGFKQGAEAMREINVSVSDLAHDFGERMNGLAKRLVTEKEKWGDTFRWVVKMVVRLLIAGCAVAMGVTAFQHFIK